MSVGLEGRGKLGGKGKGMLEGLEGFGGWSEEGVGLFCTTGTSSSSSLLLVSASLSPSSLGLVFVGGFAGGKFLLARHPVPWFAAREKTVTSSGSPLEALRAMSFSRKEAWLRWWSFAVGARGILRGSIVVVGVVSEDGGGAGCGFFSAFGAMVMGRAVSFMQDVVRMEALG